MPSSKDHGEGALGSHQELTSSDLETDLDIENHTSPREVDPRLPKANHAEFEPSPEETHNSDSSSEELPRKRRRLDNLHGNTVDEHDNNADEEPDSRKLFFGVRIPESYFPKSVYQAGVRNMLVKEEFTVLRDITVCSVS